MSTFILPAVHYIAKIKRKAQYRFLKHFLIQITKLFKVTFWAHLKQALVTAIVTGKHF